jgi:hypothetical protein
MRPFGLERLLRTLTERRVAAGVSRQRPAVSEDHVSRAHDESERLHADDLLLADDSTARLYLDGLFRDTLPYRFNLKRRFRGATPRRSWRRRDSLSDGSPD